MNRALRICGPLGAMALGGLLFASAALGQAQQGDAPFGEAEHEPSEYETEPLPWPAHIEAQPRPGLYRATFRPGAIEMVGASQFPNGKPDEAIEDETGLFCHAPGSGTTDFLQSFSGSNCASPRLSSEGGRFAMSLSCEGHYGLRQDLRLSGRADSESLEMEIRLDMRMDADSKTNMQFFITLERIGECEAP